MNIEKIILDSGLEESEAKAYMALLEIGTATVTEIAKKAGIERTLGYHVMEKLAIVGLVDESFAGAKKKMYTAKHPRYLVQFVKNKKNAWERRLKEVEEGLGDLVSLYRIAEKPVIRYQQGIEGVKNIFSETLEAKTEILSVLDIEGWDVPELKQFGKEYNQERSKRKIEERILMLDTPRGRDWMKYYKGSLKYTDYRWIKPEEVPSIKNFGGELNVYEDKVVIALLKGTNYIGVSVQSSALANILKALFELAWKSGKVARPAKRN